MPQGQSSTTDPGWEQCYAFWAFDKPYPGMIRCTVLQQAFYPGDYSGDFGDPNQEDPKSYNKPRDWNGNPDPGPIMYVVLLLWLVLLYLQVLVSW